MTETSPDELEPLVFSVIQEQSKASGHDAIGSARVHELVVVTRPAVSLAAIQRVLHRFGLEGIVTVFKDDLYRFEGLGADTDF